VNFPTHFFFEVTDDSALHAGHQEAQKSGGGHFTVTIVTNNFEGKGLMARHRLVYGALKEEMGGEIHALVIKAFTLKEYQLRS